MGLTIFKPNSRNSGGALSVSFNSKSERKGVFFELMKQTGWDEASKRGSFKGSDKINVKLSTNEVAQFIHSLETNTPFAKGLYHNSPKGGATTINLSTYKEYLILTVQKDDFKVNIGLGAAERVELREYLKFALHHIFTGIYSDDLARAKEYANKSGGDSPKSYPTRAKAKTVEDFVETPASGEELEEDDIPF